MAFATGMVSALRVKPPINSVLRKCRFLTTKVSTVHQGTAFERHSLEVLQQNMSMSLKQVGGKEDGGIDLIGWWWLPEISSRGTGTSGTISLARRRRIRVIGQCKAEKKKMGPNYFRELEGVLYRYMTNPVDRKKYFEPHDGGSQGLPVVALLISQSPFTKTTIINANSSRIPSILLHLPGDTETAQLGTAWVNPALSGSEGLLGGRMELRWERNPELQHGRPAMWWDGVRLPAYTPLVA